MTEEIVYDGEYNGLIEVYENFLWTEENITLLLQSYSDRKQQFRDPKVKKRRLWHEIQQIFKNKGYQITEDQLDRKFRNIKCTYERNKRRKLSGANCKWPYYQIMEDITSPDDDEFNEIIEYINCEEDFEWSDELIKLMLQSYHLKKQHFKNPLMKKSKLWTEITQNFKDMGYDLTEEQIEKKYRTVRSTYERINKKNIIAGETIDKWPFYDIMEKIVTDEKTRMKSPVKPSKTPIVETISTISNEAIVDRFAILNQRLENIESQIERSNNIQKERNKILENLLNLLSKDIDKQY